MKWRTFSAWLLMVVNVVLGCAYIYFLVRLNEVDKQLAKHSADKVQREYAQSVADYVRGELLGHEYTIKEKLASAKSRSDFAVRSGAQFACSKLSTSSERSLRIGVYVPSGSHTLCYSSLALVANKRGGEIGEEFLYGDPSSHPKLRNALDRAKASVQYPADANPLVTRLPLSNLPEVFELRLDLDLAQRILEVELLGSDDKVVHRATISLPDPSFKYRFAQIEGREALTYPSELTLNNFTQRVLEFGTKKPVFDLTNAFGYSHFEQGVVGKQWMTRFWIDSDAPACMSAYNAEFRKGDIMGQFGLLPANDWRVAEGLFEPYEGGLVRKLRPEALRARNWNH